LQLALVGRGLVDFDSFVQASMPFDISETKVDPADADKTNKKEDAKKDKKDTKKKVEKKKKTVKKTMKPTMKPAS
jgi:hypothetical protein